MLEAPLVVLELPHERGWNAILDLVWQRKVLGFADLEMLVVSLDVI
jgi:hypothetical protein